MGMGAVRAEERVLAAFGGLIEAPTRFEPGRDVSCGGVLWALPALLANGLLHRQAECFELPKGSCINKFRYEGGKSTKCRGNCRPRRLRNQL